jgi:hypothetical protein
MSIGDESGFGKTFDDKTPVHELTADRDTLYAIQLAYDIPDGLHNMYLQYEVFSIVALNCRSIMGVTQV